MRNKAIIFIIAAFALGCSDESEAPTVDAKQFTGIWTLREVNYPDGRIQSSPLTALSVFGVYAESIKFKEGNSYVPVIWTDVDTFSLKSMESGTFEISGDTKLILSGGAWEMEFEITKLTDDEMWLSHVGQTPLLGDPQTLYKLKRETSGY